MLHSTPAQIAPKSLSTPESPNYWQTCPHCGSKVSAPRQKAYNPLRFRECARCNLVYLPRAFAPRKQKHHLRQVFCSTVCQDTFRACPSVCIFHYAPGNDTDPFRTKYYLPKKASMKRLEKLLNRIGGHVYLDEVVGISTVHYIDGEVK